MPPNVPIKIYYTSTFDFKTYFAEMTLINSGTMYQFTFYTDGSYKTKMTDKPGHFPNADYIIYLSCAIVLK